jgi:DNA-binding CsgD family transcriptional regulator
MGRVVTREAALARAAGAAAEAVAMAELAGEAVPALGLAVGAPWFALNRFDGPGVCEPLAGDVDVLVPRTYFSRHALIDPVQLDIRRGQPRVMRASFERGRYRHSPVFEDYYRPRDIGHVLAMRLASPEYFSPGMTLLAFFRPLSRPPFAAADAGACARLVSIFDAAVRRAFRLDTERRAHAAAEALLGGRARLAIDAAGRVLWRSPSAERFDPPASLLDAARRLLAGGGSRGVELPGCRRAALAVERTRAGEPIVAVELCGGEPLTPAERLVLEALREGLSNAAIARRLRVSVGTVKTHVHRVLAKLGASSRLEAAVGRR